MEYLQPQMHTEHRVPIALIDSVPRIEYEIEDPDEVRRQSLIASRAMQFARMRNFDGNVADTALRTNSDVEVLYDGIDRLTTDLELSSEDMTALWGYARATNDSDRLSEFDKMSPQAKAITGEYWQMVNNYFSGDFGRYSRSRNIRL